MGWNDLIGMRIDQYEILEELGRGGSSHVYRALDTEANRDVALKMIPNDAEDRALFISRFTREVEAVQQLHHPHIVAVSGAGESDEFVYLVMQCVTGGTLRRQLTSPLSAPDAANYMVQMAYALQHAHDQGIIHRDVKPSNMLLEYPGSRHLLLTDFGIAKIQGARGLTKSGTTIGTPEYMSPEQAEGREIDQRADIYALGCVLYETLAGRPPFLGSTPVSVLFQQVHSRPAYIRGFNPGVPAEVVHILEIALAKRPDERYGSAESFARALRPFAGDLPDMPFQPSESGPIVISRSRGLTPSRPLPPDQRIPVRDTPERDALQNPLSAAGSGIQEETTAPLPAISARKTFPPFRRPGQTLPPSRARKTLPPFVRVRRTPSLNELQVTLRSPESGAQPAADRGEAARDTPPPPLAPAEPPRGPIPLPIRSRTLRNAISGPQRPPAQEGLQQPKQSQEPPSRRPDRRADVMAATPPTGTRIPPSWPQPHTSRARLASILAAVVILGLFGWLALNASGLGFALGGKGQPTTTARQTLVPTATAQPTNTAAPTSTAGPEPTATPSPQQILNQRASNSFRGVTLATFSDGSCSGGNYRSTFGSGQAIYVNLCTSGYAVSAPMTVAIRHNGQVVYRMAYGIFISPSSSYFYYTNHPFNSGAYDVLVTLDINGTAAVARDLTLHIT